MAKRLELVVRKDFCKDGVLEHLSLKEILTVLAFVCRELRYNLLLLSLLVKEDFEGTKALKAFSLNSM